ncbi:hypothetical protein PIROE2DRAFT_2955 [Piromyces sp. E2]|nr:hypothetical protein PIROE2DRAFT_2955 [Piromyces sp. E2]|eukprot:OUM69246.1 hypothetical protein PIROE2DRAFT_2955 [Piromyces sp. E2]
MNIKYQKLTRAELDIFIQMQIVIENSKSNLVQVFQSNSDMTVTNINSISDKDNNSIDTALLNSIISIAVGRQQSLFDRFKPNNTKNANADITVRQASKTSYIC